VNLEDVAVSYSHKMPKPKNLKKIVWDLCLVIALIGFVAFILPYPSASPTFYQMPSRQPIAPASIVWPQTGQAALGAKGYGLLETYGAQEGAPTASVAKVFTAIAVLKQRPLKVDEQGPVITINQADIDSYNTYYSQDGSLVQVALGEKITERQALEALMLPSANNMADTLARWAFGSVDHYLSYINNFNGSVGLKHTHIADASGFSSSTISSAEDLVKIGQLALADPTLAAIVSEPQATIPVAGVIRNTNWLLGDSNINGIKTGNTDAAGGCYLFSSTRVIQGKEITTIGAVMGASSLTEALTSSRALLISSDTGFVKQNIVTSNQVVGEYRLPWGKKVSITTSNDIDVVGWYTKKPLVSLNGDDMKVIKRSQTVGSLNASAGPEMESTGLVAASDSGHAPFTWRLYKRYL
jgi:D-alanyl-D-alanine carboxypeptidase (penicillin-binding protein 5/6)